MHFLTILHGLSSLMPSFYLPFCYVDSFWIPLVQSFPGFFVRAYWSPICHPEGPRGKRSNWCFRWFTETTLQWWDMCYWILFICLQYFMIYIWVTSTVQILQLMLWKKISWIGLQTLKPEGKSKVRMLQDCNKEQVIQQMLEFYQKMMSNLVGFLTKLHLCCPKLACWFDDFLLAISLEC